MKKRIIACFLCFSLLCSVMCGCTIQKSSATKDKICKVKENYVQSGVVAQNDAISLIWDAERYALLLKENNDIV